MNVGYVKTRNGENFILKENIFATHIVQIKHLSKNSS